LAEAGAFVVGVPISASVPNAHWVFPNFKFSYFPMQTVSGESEIFATGQVMWFSMDFRAVLMMETVQFTIVCELEIPVNDVISLSISGSVSWGAFDVDLRIAVHKPPFHWAGGFAQIEGLGPLGLATLQTPSARRRMCRTQLLNY